MIKDIEIGSIGEHRVYLYWSDVKKICNEAMLKENKELMAVIRNCIPLVEQAPENSDEQHIWKNAVLAGAKKVLEENGFNEEEYRKQLFGSGE